MKKILLLATLLTLCAAPAWADSMNVLLRWDANTESDLAGYKVHHGPASGSYTKSIDVPLANDQNPEPGLVDFKVQELVYGQKYYFAVTAYDTEGLESGYSNEVWTDGVTGYAPRPPGGTHVTVIEVVTASGTTIKISAP